MKTPGARHACIAVSGFRRALPVQSDMRTFGHARDVPVLKFYKSWLFVTSSFTPPVADGCACQRRNVPRARFASAQRGRCTC